MSSRIGAGRARLRVLGAVMVLGLGPAAAGASVLPLITSVQTGRAILPTYAASGPGNVLYQETSGTGTNPLFERLLGSSVPITIVGSNFGAEIVGRVSYGNDQQIAFQAVGEPGSTGVFARAMPGGVLITVTGSNFGGQRGAPSVNDTGAIAFQEITPSGPVTRSGSTGGPYLTVYGTNFGELSRPVINNAGVVATIRATAAGSAIFARTSATTSPLLTITGSNFGHLAIGDDSLIYSEGGGADGFNTLFAHPLTGGLSPLTIMDESFGRSISTISANPDGDVAIFRRGNNGTLGVGIDVFLRSSSLGDGSNAYDLLPAVQVGDALNGSTIAELALAPDGLLDNGDVVFFARTADGATGLYQFAVPEPATAALAGGLLALLLRRGRR